MLQAALKAFFRDFDGAGKNRKIKIMAKFVIILQSMVNDQWPMTLAPNANCRAVLGIKILWESQLFFRQSSRPSLQCLAALCQTSQLRKGKNVSTTAFDSFCTYLSWFWRRRTRNWTCFPQELKGEIRRHCRARIRAQSRLWPRRTPRWSTGATAGAWCKYVQVL